MTAEAILTPVITKELEKYKLNGGKIKLKTGKKRRIVYTIIFGYFCLLGLVIPACFWIAIWLYIFLMIRSGNNVKIILSLAKQNPDKPVDQIIAEEIIRR